LFNRSDYNSFAARSYRAARCSSTGLRADVGGDGLNGGDELAVTLEELTRRYLDSASLDDLGVLCGCTATRILVAYGVNIRLRGHNHGNGQSIKSVRR
jgi:hypothetical protein